ncbi:MAG TPA: queuosine precursor transporter, partial [Fervidobacterium sp.]|nr:queuosine precursor transporter [Fervidobacterium sp.]
MKKTTNISMLQLVLTVASVAAVLVSNVITTRQIQMPFGIVMSGGVLVFPITYILSDVFSEVYGYRWSRITCYLGFAANLFMVAVFAAVLASPYPSYWEHAEAFQTVLGETPRVLIASLAAFWLGDLVNDVVFRKMKEKYPKTHKGFRSRAIVSSVFGAVIDSFVFMTIAFIGKMPPEVLTVSII